MATRPFRRSSTAVTQYYDIKLTDLLSKRRHKSIALPKAGLHVARSAGTPGTAWRRSVGTFGGRDHTTVMHAVRQITSKREQDPSTRQ